MAIEKGWIVSISALALYVLFSTFSSLSLILSHCLFGKKKTFSIRLGEILSRKKITKETLKRTASKLVYIPWIETI